MATHKLEKKLQKIKDKELSKKIKIEKAVQNNINVEINLSELTVLATVNQNLADRYLSIIEKHQVHTQNIENNIIELEKNEQKERSINNAENRRFMKRGQMLAFICYTLIILFVFYCVHKGATDVTITIIISIAFLALYHVSGRKEQQAISYNAKDDIKTVSNTTTQDDK